MFGYRSAEVGAAGPAGFEGAGIGSDGGEGPAVAPAGAQGEGSATPPNASLIICRQLSSKPPRRAARSEGGGSAGGVAR